MSSAPSQVSADRNLLLGVLALQMDFITRDGLLSAMKAWAFQKGKPLGQMLVERGALAGDSRELLEALVQKHLAMHGCDTQMSLAALSSLGAVRKDLEEITDPDVQASLVHVSASATRAPDDDPHPSPAASVGGSTSSGQRFRVLRPHAKGGLGAVFVAQDQELHREVALKEIQDRHADHPESRSRFLLEAEITGGLEHPGIVPVYGLGAYGDGRPYYAMRFIRGDSLKEAIERFHRAEPPDPGQRTLEFRKLLGRFVDVCNAIDYAHSRGVLHRDLKPGNIMLGQYGETLVVDWGLAKPMDRPEIVGLTKERTLRPPSLSGTAPTHMGEALGTPQYMSPEQAAGKLNELGPASDVYSLGATLYCLLTGKAPFEDANIATILTKVQRGDFPRPRQVKVETPPALEAVCLKAMGLKPSERYASARALADDVESWLADEPVSAWPEPWTVRTRRWISRHRLLVGTGSAAFLVATISLAIATALLTAANERERAARALAVEREHEARHEKEKAEHNYQLARQAVDRYHTEVSESILLHEPGLEPLRKKLLEAARDFYERFVHERQDDPGAQGEMGKALFRLAQISGDVDSRFKAIELHKQGLAVFSALCSAHPEALSYQADLALSQHQLGRLYRLTDQTSEAEASYNRAVALWERLLAQPATGVDSGQREPVQEKDQSALNYRAEMARTLLGLGNVCQQTGRFEDARKTYERALDLREELIRQAPARAEYRRDLAVSHKNLAACLLSKHEFTGAEAHYRAAAAIQEKLAQDFSPIKQYQDDLAGTYASLGNLFSRPEDSAKAEMYLQKAADIWRHLAEAHPAVTDFSLALAGVYNNLANRYRAAGRTADAERAYRLALDIREKLAANARDVPAHQADLAKLHRNLGNLYRSTGQFEDAASAFQTALGAQERLAREHADIPQYQDDLAATSNDLGLLLQASGKSSEAEAAFRRALATWEKLSQGANPAVEHLVGLGVSCRNLADVLRDAGDPATAIQWYGRAMRALEQGSVSQRRPAEQREALRNSYWGRAEALTRLGRHSEAVKDWNRTIELADADSRAWFSAGRLAALARMGGHRVAADEAEHLLTDKQPGDVLYKLAGVYALATGTARNDESLSSTEQTKLADKYAGRAFDLLHRAAAQGFGDNAAGVSKLEKDPDFDSIRADPRFDAIVQPASDAKDAQQKR